MACGGVLCQSVKLHRQEGEGGKTLSVVLCVMLCVVLGVVLCVVLNGVMLCVVLNGVMLTLYLSFFTLSSANQSKLHRQKGGNNQQEAGGGATEGRVRHGCVIIGYRLRGP